MYLKRFKNLYDTERPRIPELEHTILRLQRNEKPDDWDDEVYRLICDSLPRSILQKYPDPIHFYEKLSAFINIPQERIVVTSGIDEPIRSLMLLCCEPGDVVSVPTPTYAMYSVYAEMLGVRLHNIPLMPGQYLSEKDLIRHVDTSSKILFLPNPSQPIENLYSLTQLSKIASFCQQNDTLLAIDEAYQFMGADSALPLTETFENVLVMRTFSKAFGAASIRLGYTVGSEEAVKPLSAFRLAHESNAMSLHVGSILLDQFDTIVSRSISRILQGRDFLRQASLDYGWQAWGEAGNYVLIDLADPELRDYTADKLADRGIHVKGNFSHPLESHILVTCGPVEMMRTFFDNLKDIVKSAKT